MHLNISPSSARLADVRRAARAVLRSLPTDVAHDLLLALDEAVSNAVRHGSAGGGPVEVSIEFAEGWVELRVLDRGPTAAVPALPADPPSPMALGGRGLWLIRQLADEVRVEPAGRGTLLAIRRRAGSAGSRPPGATGEPTGRDRGRTWDGRIWLPGALKTDRDGQGQDGNGHDVRLSRRRTRGAGGAAPRVAR